MTRRERRKRTEEKRQAILKILTGIFTDTLDKTASAENGMIPVKDALAAVDGYIARLIRKYPFERALYVALGQRWGASTPGIVREYAIRKAKEEANGGMGSCPNDPGEGMKGTDPTKPGEDRQ